MNNTDLEAVGGSVLVRERCGHFTPYGLVVDIHQSSVAGLLGAEVVPSADHEADTRI